jgi:septal ring factor EnvC (AmiA/AmiB activator)
MKHALLTALAIALAGTVHPLPSESEAFMRQVRADSPKLQTNNIDFEVARVKKLMREIQDQPIARDAKIQKQRALIESEMARARAQMREIQESDSKGTGTSKETKETKEDQASARDRRKAAMDNLQKFLDILRSMNPQI